MNLLSIFEPAFWISMLCSLPGIVIGLSFHEFGHAFAAYKMGDPTARNVGRMTLNPMAHVDWIGLACLVFLGFGWAKPVPVNPSNYKGNKRVADIFVSLAGIIMNFILAFVLMLIMYTLAMFKVKNDIIYAIIQNAIIINLSLMVFNLIPVPPLDGSHILEDLLIGKVPFTFFAFLRKYGMIILIIAIMILNTTGILSTIVGGIYNGLSRLFALIFSAYI